MARHSEKVSKFLRDEIDRGSFPGAQYLIGDCGRVAAEGAIGNAVIEPELLPATIDTVYDLASLTKPLVTSLLMVKLYEGGTIDINAPVSDYLGEFRGEAGTDRRGPITVKRLMTHTSGLPNWRPLYLECRSREEVPSFIARVSIDSRDREAKAQLTYSDLNYILLGFLLERVTGIGLDELARREIFAPLALVNTTFNPPAELKRRIAATERGQEFERANAMEDLRQRAEVAEGRRGEEMKHFASSCDHMDFNAASPLHPISSSPLDYHWREGVIWGEVHDGNAHFLGGVAGHAGLFSTAREVFRIANQFLQGSELLKPDTLSLFTEDMTPGTDTARSIGWILCSTADCSAGPAMPPTGMGHNGFTGTSVWMDTQRRRVFILLTNRVHPKVTAVDMKTIRQQFNSLACKTASEVSG